METETSQITEQQDQNNGTEKAPETTETKPKTEVTDISMPKSHKDISVQFSAGLKNYHDLLSELISVAPSINSPRELVLQFNSAEEANEKLEALQALNLDKSMVSFSIHGSEEIDPVCKVAEIGHEIPDVQEKLKELFGAENVTEIFKFDQPTGSYKLEFSSEAVATAAQKKDVTLGDLKIHLKNCTRGKRIGDSDISMPASKKTKTEETDSNENGSEAQA